MMIHKLKTFLRIQKRMLWIYLLELWFFIEWPLAFTLNWFIIFLMPIWIGVYFMLAYIARGMSSRKNVERDVITGRVLFWESFKQF